MLSSRTREAAVVCLLLCVVYIGSPGFVPSSDTHATVFAPVVTIETGHWTITQQDAPFMFGSDAQHVKYYLFPTRWPDHYVNAYGPLPGLMLLGPLWLLRWIVGDLREHTATVWLMAKLCCSLCAALSGAFLYLAARSFGARRHALLATLGFALGTVVWSVASQTPYQQSFALPWLTLGLALALSERADFAAGTCLALAGVVREPLLVFAAAHGVTLLWQARQSRRLISYALGLAWPLLALVLYNVAVFDHWHAPSQLQRAAADYAGQAFGTPLATGLAGVLFSPSRGLWVYSPFLLFSVWGALRVVTQPRWSALRPFLCGCALLLALYAKWSIWWGGWCFGPRLLIDVVPAMCLLLLPALSDLTSRRAQTGFGLLLALGVVNSALGALAYDLLGWDAREGYAVIDPNTRAARVFLDRERAQLVAAASGHELQTTRLDVDKPQFRGRLWRVMDSPLPYYAAHFSEARARRSVVMQRAIESVSWDPRPAQRDPLR